MQNLGKTIVVVGIILVVVGLILWFGDNKFSWFGNLPGDIRIKRENFHFYMPITTMILVSILLSLVLWLARKFL